MLTVVSGLEFHQHAWDTDGNGQSPLPARPAAPLPARASGSSGYSLPQRAHSVSKGRVVVECPTLQLLCVEDADGYTALDVAVGGAHWEAAKLLAGAGAVQVGADPHGQGKGGCRACNQLG